MKLKKIVALLLVGVMATSMLAGCWGDEDDSSSSSSSSSGSTTGGDTGGTDSDDDDDEGSSRYTVTLQVGKGGSSTPDGSFTVNRGDDTTITITSNTGYDIASVSVNGTPETVSNKKTHTVSLQNVTSNVTVAASFTASSVDSISISGTPSKTTYAVGESFEPAGLVATVHYANGDSEEVTLTNDNASVDGNNAVKGGVTTFTIVYGGQSATYTLSGVTITPDESPYGESTYLTSEEMALIGEALNTKILYSRFSMGTDEGILTILKNASDYTAARSALTAAGNGVRPILCKNATSADDIIAYITNTLNLAMIPSENNNVYMMIYDTEDGPQCYILFIKEAGEMLEF